MYLVKVEVKSSEIEGKGVFSLEYIKKGEIVWRFDPTHDRTLTLEEFKKLDKDTQASLKRVSYLSKSSGRLVYPPENDPALYTNHSDANNLSCVTDQEVSEEPFFIANRDICTGEELTNNYQEFDAFSKNADDTWL